MDFIERQSIGQLVALLVMAERNAASWFYSRPYNAQAYLEAHEIANHIYEEVVSAIWDTASTVDAAIEQLVTEETEGQEGVSEDQG